MKSKRLQRHKHRTEAAVFLAALAAPVVVGGAPPTAAAAPGPRTPAALRDGSPSLDIVRVGDELPGPDNAVHLPRVHQGAGLDVRIRPWPRAEATRAWLRVEAPDGTVTGCFGPARPSGIDDAVITGVQLGTAASQPPRLVLRAFTRLPGALPGLCDDLKSSPLISEAVKVGVATLQFAEADLRLRIATIGDRPPSDEPILTPSSVLVAIGRIENGKEVQARGLVYLMRHLRGPDYQAFGPAEVRGQLLLVRDVWLGNEAEMGGISQDLLAVELRAPIQGQVVPHSVWRPLVIAASEPVAVMVRRQAAATILIDSLIVAKAEESEPVPVADAAEVSVDSIDQVRGIVGPALQPGRGALTVLAAGEGESWWAIGRARVRGHSYRWQGVIPANVNRRQTRTVRLMVVAGTELPMGTVVTDQGLARQALASSDVVTIRIVGAVHARREMASPVLTHIGTERISGQIVPARGARSVRGTLDVPRDAPPFSVRAALQMGQDDSWFVSQPAIVKDGRWEVMSFPQLAGVGDDQASELRILLIDGRTLSSPLSSDDLADATLVSSAPVMVTATGVSVARGGAAEAPAATSWSWTGALVGLLLLATLFWLYHRRSPMLSNLFDAVRKPLARAADAFRDAVADLAKHEGDSRVFKGKTALADHVLGVAILAILALAISCYLTIYEFVISSALETAPKATTNNLATALIIFAAMAGMLLEITSKLLWPGPNLAGLARGARLGLAFVVATLMVACTVALIGVQVMIYAKYYHHAAPAVALAFGGAALLMSVTEVVGFAVGLNLGFCFAVWLALMGAIWLPLVCAATVLEVSRDAVKPAGANDANPPARHRRFADAALRPTGFMHNGHGGPPQTPNKTARKDGTP